MFSSCNEFLNVNPDNRTQIDTPEKVRQMLVSAYPENSFAVMGESAWPGVILLHFVLPALLTWFFARILEGRGLIRPGDMTLDREA